MMDTIAVVGGAGFIGTRFCQELQRYGLPFRIIDKRVSETFPTETVVADVTEVDSLRAALAGSCAIVNLAAEHKDNVLPKSRYYEVNVQGAKNVCAAADSLSIPEIIFTSSVAVYGHASPNTAEDGRISPFNEYGKTKAAAEQIYRDWQLAAPASRSLVVIRPTVVFGEGNRGNVYNLLRQISSGLFVMIGSGGNRKSMAYVGNVASFLRHMLSTEPGIHICNYVDKPDLSMVELAEIALSAFGRSRARVPRIPYFVGYLVGALFDMVSWSTRRQFPISRIRVKKFCATTQFDSAATRYGFEAPYSLQQGMEATLRADFLSGPTRGPLFFSE